MPRAFEYFLSPWTREFDVKVHPGGGEFHFACVGWGILAGNVKLKICFGGCLSNAHGSIWQLNPVLWRGGGGIWVQFWPMGPEWDVLTGTDQIIYDQVVFHSGCECTKFHSSTPLASLPKKRRA